MKIHDQQPQRKSRNLLAEESAALITQRLLQQNQNRTSSFSNNATNISTNATTSNATQMANLTGCQVINTTDSKSCIECNQQSTLNNGTCKCIFNYTLTITPHQEEDGQAPEESPDTPTNNSNATYDYLVGNFLVFDDSIPNGEFFNCSELLELKFPSNNQSARNQTQGFLQRANVTRTQMLVNLTKEFQTLQCQMVLFFYIRYDPFAFTNELRILNLSSSLNDAFNAGQVEFHIKKDKLEFECEGKNLDYAIKMNGSWHHNLTEEPQSDPDIPGCLIYLESFPRQCGLCYPYALASGRQCLCQFRFNVSIEDDLNQIVIRHFLNISESLLFNNRTARIFNCSDHMSFTYQEIGLNETLKPDQDALRCIFQSRVVNESEIPENDTSVHYSSILTISNASDLFIQAFSFGLINITFNKNISNQTCVGDLNHTINYAESECGNQTCFGQWGLLDVFDEGASLDDLNDQIDILFPDLVDLFGNLTDLIKVTQEMMANQSEASSNQQDLLDQPSGGGSRLLAEQDSLLGSEQTSCSDGCFACDKKTYSCSMCKIGWVRKYENGRFICYHNPCASMMRVRMGNRTWGYETRVYDAKTRKCVTCPDGCSNCTTTGECTECKDGYFEFRTKSKKLQCYEACPTDTYSDFDNQRCTICDPQCSQCKKDPNYACQNKNNYGTCQKSDKGFWEISCKRTCSQGYRASNGWCHKCPDNCEECSSDDECTKCSSGHTLSEGSCSQEVCDDSHEYYDQNGGCSPCNSECKTCSIYASNCTSCPSGYYLEPISGKCINQPSGGGAIPIQCLAGFGYDIKKNQCVRCPNGCKMCSDSQNCTSCNSRFVYMVNETTQIGSCKYLQCPDGYYYNSTHESCQACGEGCQKCTRLSQCNICMPDWYRGRGGCFKNCSENQYLTKDSNKFYKCSDCPQNCSKCSQDGTCLECEPGYVRVMSHNVSQVSDSVVQKIVGKYCVARPGNCPSGMYYNGSYDSCVSCREGCANCDNDGVCHQNCTPMNNCNACSIKPEMCVICEKGYHQQWDQSVGYTCSPQIQKCNQTDQYYDTRTNQCEYCTQNCEKCVNDTYCKTCEKGYYKILLPTITLYNETMLSTQCVANCSDYSGYFTNIRSKVCQQCTRNCLQCSSKSQCEVCDEYTVKLKGQCACQNRQRVKLYPSKYQAEIDIYNLKWLPNYNYIFNGAPFYCKDIFNIEFDETEDNATMSNYYNAFDYLTCLAAQKQDDDNNKNYVRIDMYNITKDLQDGFRTQQVALILDPDVYDQQCITAWEVYQIFFPKAQYVNNTLQDMNGRRILEAEGSEEADLSILDKEFQTDQLLYFRDEKQPSQDWDMEENNKQDSYISITVIIASFLLTAVLVGAMLFNCSQNKKPRRRILYDEDDGGSNNMELQQSKANAYVREVINQNPEELDGQ